MVYLVFTIYMVAVTVAGGGIQRWYEDHPQQFQEQVRDAAIRRLLSKQ